MLARAVKGVERSASVGQSAYREISMLSSLEGAFLGRAFQLGEKSLAGWRGVLFLASLYCVGQAGSYYYHLNYGDETERQRLRKPLEDIGLISPPPPPVFSKPNIYAYVAGYYFPRPDKEAEMLEALSGLHVYSRSFLPVLRVVGRGGTGKTLMVMQVLDRYVKEHPTSLVQVISAENEEMLFASLERFVAEDLGMDMRRMAEEKEQAFRTRLMTVMRKELKIKYPNWILVFDLGSKNQNWLFKTLTSYIDSQFPSFDIQFGEGKIILSTANVDSGYLSEREGTYWKAVELDGGLSVAETRGLFLEHFLPEFVGDGRTLEELAEYVGYSPLALHTAALTISARRKTEPTYGIDGYLRELREVPSVLEEMHGRLRQSDDITRHYQETHHQVVLKALQASTELEREVILAMTILGTVIPVSVLAEPYRQSMGLSHEAFRGALVSLGLVHAAEDGSMRTNDYVVDAARQYLSTMPKADQDRIYWRLLPILLTQIGDTTREPSLHMDGPVQRNLIKQLITIINGIDGDVAAMPEAQKREIALAKLKLAGYYARSGRADHATIRAYFMQGIEWLEFDAASALNLAKANIDYANFLSLKAADPKAAKERADSAATLVAKYASPEEKAKLTDAEQTQYKSIQADLLARKASTAGQMRRLGESRALRSEALDLYTELGDMDKVRESLYWQGFWGKTVHDFDFAISKYTESFKLATAHLGEQHPLIASIYNDMGIVYANAGHFEEALELHLKAIATKKHDLASREPDSKLAQYYRDYAQSCILAGQMDQASSSIEQALAIHVRCYPARGPAAPDHPVLERTREVQGDWYLASARESGNADALTKALACYERVYSDRQKTPYGPKHTVQSEILYRLGEAKILAAELINDSAMRDMGVKHLQQAIEIYEDVSNFEYYQHYPLYVKTLGRLAAEYEATDALGASHPQTIEILFKLCRAMSNGAPSEEEMALRKRLSIWVAEHGVSATWSEPTQDFAQRFQIEQELMRSVGVFHRSMAGDSPEPDAFELWPERA